MIRPHVAVFRWMDYDTFNSTYIRKGLIDDPACKNHLHTWTQLLGWTDYPKISRSGYERRPFEFLSWNSRISPKINQDHSWRLPQNEPPNRHPARSARAKVAGRGTPGRGHQPETRDDREPLCYRKPRSKGDKRWNLPSPGCPQFSPCREKRKPHPAGWRPSRIVGDRRRRGYRHHQSGAGGVTYLT